MKNKISQCEAARRMGVDESTVRAWTHRYREQGEGSLRAVAAKYGLRNAAQLNRWVRMYNNGEDFSHKMSGESHIKTSRKTTKEERIQIVEECLENGHNYGEDRRGKRKVDQEPRSEVEKLQIEVEQLKHKLNMAEMERDLFILRCAADEKDYVYTLKTDPAT